MFKNSKVIYNNLSVKNKKKNIPIRKYKKIRCLVTPEKNISETMALVDVINKIYEKNNKIQFKLRLHPNLSKDENLKIKNKCNKNININKSSLSEDLKKNNIIIYKGSSVCFNAIENGLMPLYFNNNKFNIDPIKSLEIKQNYFSNSEDFLDKISKIRNNKIIKSKIKKIF